MNKLPIFKYSLLSVMMLSLSVLAEELPLDADVERGKDNCILQQTCQINRTVKSIQTTVNDIDSRLQCQSAIAFGSADINKPGGYVISKPGLYCLKEDVVFTPAASTFLPPDPRAVQAAITIRSSDVFLDLGAHTLSQAGVGTSNQVPYAIAILIPDLAPGNTDKDFIALQSIYIKGDDPAIIDGFSMYGIRAFAHVYDLQIRNLTIKNTGILASRALRPALTPIYSPTSFGSAPFGVGGIALGESSILGMGPTFFANGPFGNNTHIRQIQIENVSCLNNYLNGIIAPNSADVTINNCHFDDTYTDEIGTNAIHSANAIGANFSSWDLNTFPLDTQDPIVQNLTITNTTVNNTTVRNGDFATFVGNVVAGLQLQTVKNGVFTNIEVNNTGHNYRGFVIPAIPVLTSEEMTFTNVHADGTYGIGGLLVWLVGALRGFGTGKSPLNHTFINCTANNTIEISDLQIPLALPINGGIGGFDFNDCKNLVVDGCEANGSLARGPLGFGPRIIGFRLRDDGDGFPHPTPPADLFSQNIVFRNCVASGNKTLQGGSVAGFGTSVFQFSPVEPIVWQGVSYENCIASGNVALVPTIPNLGLEQGLAFGFFMDTQATVQPTGQPSVPFSFIGCSALHNKGLISSTWGGPNAVYSAGFAFFDRRRTDVTNCEAIDNIYGFLLQRCDRCALRNNRADNNVDDLGTTGEGFTDLGTPGVPAGALGTPGSPGQSTSLFEFNHAFANGNDATQIGLNGNYNVFVDPTATVALPMLRGRLSTSVYTYNDPAFYTPVHNVSIVN